MHSIPTRSLLVAVVTLLALTTPRLVAAQSTTAFKSGEETTGMTKQCFYDALGSAYTKTVSSIDLCPLTIQVRSNPYSGSPSASSAPRPERTSSTTGFKTGEVTTGMTKQCFYDALGSSYTKTMSSIDLCPLTIQVRNP